MEEIKDLGGLVNKDLAFSKLPQGSVFDSVNFRITTEDGNSSAARENIKGNLPIASLQASPCVKTIYLNKQNLEKYLVIGDQYTIIFSINNNPSGNFLFTYSTVDTLLTDLNNYINTNSVFTNLAVTTSYSIAASTITLFVPNCESIDIYSITSSNNSPYYLAYDVADPEAENIQVSAGLTWNDIYDYYNGVWSGVNNNQWQVDSNFNPTTSPGGANNLLEMGVGVYNGSTLISPQTTRIRYEVNTGSGAPRKVLFVCPVNNGVSLFNAQDYPAGPYTVDLKYFVANIVNCSAVIKVYGHFGNNITAPADVLTGLNSYNNEKVVKMYEGTININSANSASIVNTTFSFSAPPAQLNGDVPDYFAVYLDIQSGNAGPQYTFQFYLDSLRISGPFIGNNASLITIQNTSVGSIAGNIIGWTALRDDIYLFTTDGIYDPDDPTTWGGSTPPVTNGQIWKFSYDKAGDYADSANYQLTLVYNNQLNFTTSRPIANPGMIESRYESPSIQKIYWTDNYNVPRQINVADPNVASLTVEDLNLQPALSMDLPVVTRVIDGGGLLVGVYQVAYRLKNINGAETRFSRTSNLIPIIEAAENNADAKTYFPTADVRDNAGKSIKVRVENVDISYNTVEFAILYYFDATSVPEIYIVKEAFIPSSGIVETVITGTETQIPITVDEFTGFNTAIKRAKTLAAKKQTLFLGNVTIADQEVPFDSRAYRFPINSNITYIQDVSNGAFYSVTRDPATNNFYYEGNPADQVPETHGCIQQYVYQGPEVDSNYLYLPGTNILGGKGPNVSYEFYTGTFKLDNKNDGVLTDPGASGPHMTPDTNVLISFNSLDRSYTAEGTSLSSNASPYVYDIYVGYRRDEMYRFGLVFFDELDNPTYVNWIADIRMPHIWMPGTTRGAMYPNSPRTKIDSSFNSTFSSDISFYDTTLDDLWAKPLGVKFTIDFSSVASKYKKAAIVRTPLTVNDRHILGQGLFLPTFKSDGVGGQYNDSNSVFTCNAAKGNYAYNANNDMWFDCWTMHSPEFLFTDFPGFTGNDSIDVLGLLYKSDISYLMGEISTGFVALDRKSFSNNEANKKWTAFINKNYELNESSVTPSSIKNTATANPYPLVNARVIDRAGTNGRFYNANITTTTASGGFSTARKVYNCTPKNLNTSGGGLSYPSPVGYSYGSKSLFVQMQAQPAANWNVTPFGNEFYQLDGWDTNTSLEFYHYTANYKKALAAPFGGQDYFARSNSEYIPCNNLIDISNKTAPIQTIVFGGDTKIAVFDHAIQHFDRAEAVAMGSNQETDMYYSQVYFPVETSVGVDYRRTNGNVPFGSPGTQVPNKTNYLILAYGYANSQWDTRESLENGEYFEVDPVFNHTDKSVYRYFPKPALIDPSLVYDCRVWRSEKKIDGELTESWSVFKPSSFLDVESAYGPLNNLVVFQDKLFFIQDRGFGVLQVAEQKLITDQAGNADLVLGSSGILERYDYISTKTGTKHQFSMYASDYSLVWFDTLARKMYRYKPGALEPLTDVKGYSGIIYNKTHGPIQTIDNPYRMVDDPIQGIVWRPYGIHSTYDFKHHEFYMTFLNPLNPLDNQASDYTTLVYSDLFDGFVGEFTHYPKVYINDKVNIFSPYLTVGSTLDTIFIHNYGDYGRFYNAQIPDYSSVSFVVNSNPTLEKTFTNLEVVAEGYSKNTVGVNLNPHKYDSLAAIDYYNFFEDMRVFDNYQNTDWIPLSILSRRHKTIWNIKVPSDRVIDVTNNIFDPANLAAVRPSITRRMKDKWFVVEMKYNNTPNNKFVVHTAKAIYSANSR